MKYTADNFHLHYIPHYRLLIRSDFLEDTLLVLDDSNEVQALYSYPSDSPDPAAVKLLGLPFQDVSVSLPLQSLQFIPLEVFKQQDLAHYQDFLLDEHQTRTQTFTVPNFGITGIYQYDLLLKNRWSTLFPAAKFVSDSYVFLRLIAAYVPAQGTILGIHVKDKQVEFGVFLDGELKLYNIFDSNTSDDLHYFLLNVCKTLAIAPAFGKIVVSGIDRTHAFAKLVAGYSPVVEYLTSTTKMSSVDRSVLTKLESLNLLADYPICVL